MKATVSVAFIPVGSCSSKAHNQTLIRARQPICLRRFQDEDFLDLVETLDELKDKKLLSEIERARAEYNRGRSVPTERLFKKMGL